MDGTRTKPAPPSDRHVLRLKADSKLPFRISGDSTGRIDYLRFTPSVYGVNTP